MKFYIQNTTARSNWGEAVWWGKDRCGYTSNLDMAGLYDEVEARAIEASRPEQDKAYPRDVVDAVARVIRYAYPPEAR